MPDDNVLQFPLELGSLRYISITVSRVEWTRSWTLRSYHIHDSQKTMECPSAEYEDLTLTEAIDVAISLISATNDQYERDPEGGCVHRGWPGAPPTSTA